MHLQLRHMSNTPTMHKKQPIQPKNVSVSFKNIDDRIAHITTDNAPSGVTITA